MPQSKTHASRAKKLAKRRAASRRADIPYTEMLDELRARLNNRFYEEQGFPHLEILADRYEGPVIEGNLSNYFELQSLFIGMSMTLAHALESRNKFSMEKREDHCCAVAYAIAATLLDLRGDFRDTSGWAGEKALGILRRRWGRAKMEYAGISDTAKYMDDRSLACYFGMDFVMTFLDLTGQLAQRNRDAFISVSAMKDIVISHFTSYVTANEALGGSKLVDLEDILNSGTVTDEFLREYPNWQPEAADALAAERLGFNMLDDEDMAYLEGLAADPHFLHDMRALYVRGDVNSIPQGLREEIVMGYALRFGPRSKKAFEAGREPTDAEMDLDAEVINMFLITVMECADADFVEGVDNDPAPGESRGDDDTDSHVYRITGATQVEETFAAWRAGRLAAGPAPAAPEVSEASDAPSMTEETAKA